MIDWKKVEENYYNFVERAKGPHGLTSPQTMYTYVLDLNKRLEKLEKQQKNY